MKKRKKLLIVLLCGLLYNVSIAQSSNYKVILSKNMKENKIEKMDINTVTKEEMIANKITMKIANGIINYKNLTGGFLDLAELKRINGIGSNSFETIKNKFKIEKQITKKRFNINNIDDKSLELFGFTKKEIKAINEYKNKNQKIRSNIDLMKILTESRYNKYKNIVNYDNFNL